MAHLDLDATPRNADWLRTMTWDGPPITTVDDLVASLSPGLTLAQFITMPAFEALPLDIRAQAQFLVASYDGAGVKGETKYDPGQRRDANGRWTVSGSPMSATGAGWWSMAPPASFDPSQGGGRGLNPALENTVVHPEIAQRLARAVAENGGFTYQPMERRAPESGMALSIYPERGKVVDAKALQAGDIQDYAVRNLDLLDHQDADGARRNFMGGWHDTESGKVYLDISRVVSDPQEAASLCRQHQQIAYYDLAKGETVVVDANAKVPTGSKDAPPAGPHRRFIYTILSPATADHYVAQVHGLQGDAKE